MTQTISVLAQKFGLRPDTLRYYERAGLLRPPERSSSGYRLYDEPAAERLQFIKSAQRMGLRLGDIRELLEVRERGQCPCGHTEVLVQRRLADVNSQIKQLAAVQRQLLDLQKRNEDCMDATAGGWSCATGIGEGGER